eukprot:2679549-Rhodomonas_salina.3
MCALTQADRQQFPASTSTHAAARPSVALACALPAAPLSTPVTHTASITLRSPGSVPSSTSPTKSSLFLSPETQRLNELTLASFHVSPSTPPHSTPTLSPPHQIRSDSAPNSPSGKMLPVVVYPSPPLAPRPAANISTLIHDANATGSASSTHSELRSRLSTHDHSQLEQNAVNRGPVVQGNTPKGPLGRFALLHHDKADVKDVARETTAMRAGSDPTHNGVGVAGRSDVSSARGRRGSMDADSTVIATTTPALTMERSPTQEHSTDGSKTSAQRHGLESEEIALEQSAGAPNTLPDIGLNLGAEFEGLQASASQRWRQESEFEGPSSLSWRESELEESTIFPHHDRDPDHSAVRRPEAQDRPVSDTKDGESSSMQSDGGDATQSQKEKEPEQAVIMWLSRDQRPETTHLPALNTSNDTSSLSGHSGANSASRMAPVFELSSPSSFASLSPLTRRSNSDLSPSAKPQVPPRLDVSHPPRFPG